MNTESAKIKMKILKWKKSFVRDKWSNLKSMYWNEMIKEEIINLENKLKNE